VKKLIMTLLTPAYFHKVSHVHVVSRIKGMAREDRMDLTTQIDDATFSDVHSPLDRRSRSSPIPQV
jgi:hypothetical protein